MICIGIRPFWLQVSWCSLDMKFKTSYFIHVVTMSVARHMPQIICRSRSARVVYSSRDLSSTTVCLIVPKRVIQIFRAAYSFRDKKICPKIKCVIFHHRLDNVIKRKHFKSWHEWPTILSQTFALKIYKLKNKRRLLIGHSVARGITDTCCSPN